MDPYLFELNAKLEGSHWWYLARAQIIRALAERLVPSTPITRVVEVGCGTGGVLAALSEGWNRVGVDPSPTAIQFGEDLYPQLDLRLGIAPDDVEEELGLADLVLICDVLEHVENDIDLFSKILGQLKLGSQIILTVPADPTLWTSHDVVHGHFRRYTRDRLERLWNGHDSLNVRLLSPLNWRLFPLVRLVRTGSQLLGNTPGPKGSDLFLPPRPLNALLRSIFFSEHKYLLAGLDQTGRPIRRRGVSWIVVLGLTSSREDQAGTWIEEGEDRPNQP